MNSIQLIGRLTSKPELRYTTSDKAVSNFNIAVNRNFTNADGSRDADFISCQVWNKQAENLVKYQDKGSLISVEGNLRVEQFEDKDGNNRYKTYVAVNNIEYLSPVKSGQNAEIPQKSPVEPEEDPFDSTDVYKQFGEEIAIEDNFLE
jgi:single-strand DNA-binding protein